MHPVNVETSPPTNVMLRREAYRVRRPTFGTSSVSSLISGAITVLLTIWLISERNNDSVGVWFGVLAFAVLIWLVGWFFIWMFMDQRSRPEYWKAARNRPSVFQLLALERKYTTAKAVAAKYPAQPDSEAAQQLIEYLSHKDFEIDRPRWLGQGWSISSITDVPQRPGIARAATLGLVGAIVFRPGSHVYVTYERRFIDLDR